MSPGVQKTDQEGKGVKFALHQLMGSPMCPVAAVHGFLGIRPPGGGPFLIHRDGTFLSVYQFVQVFRKVLAQLGHGALDFSSDSFRIGAVTEAARWGLSPDAVKRIGRWESARYRVYVRPHLLRGLGV